MKNKEVLWEQTIDRDIDWSGKVFEIITCTFFGLLIFNDLSSFLEVTGREYNVWFWSILKVGCLAAAGLYLLVTQIFVAITLKYQITPDYLIYNWGVKKSILVEIPLTDITAINLVEYDNSDESTLYIMTQNDYPELFKGSFDNDDPRHTYTLEKIKNGPEVYQLLMERSKIAHRMTFN